METRTVRSAEDLKQVVHDYLDFSEFAFDVETKGTRPSRQGGIPGELPKQSSSSIKHVGRFFTCLVCGRRHQDARRQEYCSKECRSSAAKDPPALDPRTNKIWSISLAGPGRSDVIPCGHPDKRVQLRDRDVFDLLEPLFFSDRRKINQNVGFDLLSVSKYYDWEIPDPPYGDTMVLIFLLNENLLANEGGYNLANLTKRYLRFEYVEKLGEEAYSVEFERAMRYSIIDAKMAWVLWRTMSRRYQGQEMRKLRALLDLEMEVLHVLLHMRQHGACVEMDRFRELNIELKVRLDVAEERAKQIVADGWPSREINLNSTQKLAEYLYKIKKLHCPKYTDKGKPSVDAEVLKILAPKSPAAAAVLEYRDLNKMISTYIGGYIPLIHPDQRIRASFNQAVAKTGRLSCSSPNLQNIPARWKATFEATMVRQLFVAPPGKKLIVADYSQIELRILAHQTRDAKLMYAYTHDLDLHTQTAALIYKVPPDQVDPEQRSIAKNSNFNFAFEGGPGRVVEMSGIPEREAQKVYDGWHAAYPGVKEWGKSVKAFCRKNEYVETLYGRRRRLPDIRSADWGRQKYAERQAVNHPIQGSAADIAKIAIVQVHKALWGLDAELILQVHDEFIIECDENAVERALPLVREAMEDVRLRGRPVLDVPLVANISVGNNWAECK